MVHFGFPAAKMSNFQSLVSERYFDTKINATLVISELMASTGKVLNRFHRHGEKFTAILHFSVNEIFSLLFI